MKIKKQKEGISLIVLVITIIVMIILAATIIISLTNNGIIDKASDAVDKTNEKQVEELVNLAWADAYAENVGKSDEELLPLLKASVEKALSDNNLNKEDYGIYVTTTGVTVAKGWLQTKDRTVVKGDTVLNIGDDISYDETRGGTVTVETDVDWKVLGAENGELLILSTVSYDFVLTSFDYKKNGLSDIDTECEKYGKGKYAIGARSLRIEDVDKITGYDKTTYGKGTTEEYGTVVKIKYNGTVSPSYECSNGVSGTVNCDYNYGFTYIDGSDKSYFVKKEDLIDESNIGKTIIEITNTAYSYNLDSFLDKSDKAYEMFYGFSNSVSRLFSTCTYFNGEEIIWCCFGLGGGTVSLLPLGCSTGTGGVGVGTIRAVVQLSPTVQLTGSSTSGWNIQ